MVFLSWLNLWSFFLDSTLFLRLEPNQFELQSIFKTETDLIEPRLFGAVLHEG
jgi:hypothetical protein